MGGAKVRIDMDTKFVWIKSEDQLIIDQDICRIQYTYSFNQMGNLKGKNLPATFWSTV